jgi:DNA-binding NarL/FixJ family response regulator
MTPSESEKQGNPSRSGEAGDQPVASETGNVAKAAPQRPAILIVEDDFLIAMEAESALIAAGFQIIGIAATAEEAISLARAHKPAIAIMDIRLAGRRDGIDAAGDLYSEIGLRCVFATAHDDPQTRARATPLSPLGWLSKPYTMTSLINQVREAIAKSSSR